MKPSPGYAHRVVANEGKLELHEVSLKKGSKQAQELEDSEVDLALSDATKGIAAFGREYGNSSSKKGIIKKVDHQTL